MLKTGDWAVYKSEAPFKRGDVVSYVYPSNPRGYGALAVVLKFVPATDSGYAHDGVEVQWISWPKEGLRAERGNWVSHAWVKVGHIDLPPEPPSS